MAHVCDVTADELPRFGWDYDDATRINIGRSDDGAGSSGEQARHVVSTVAVVTGTARRPGDPMATAVPSTPPPTPLPLILPPPIALLLLPSMMLGVPMRTSKLARCLRRSDTSVCSLATYSSIA